MNPVLCAALLALQASLPLSPAQIMARATAKAISDSQTLKDKYLFDIIKKPNQPPRCKNPNDARVSIPELFGKGRYDYTYTSVKAVVYEGRPTFKIEFSPDDTQPDAPDGASKCSDIANWSLNQLSGTVYVDLEEFGIVRVETHVTKPPAKKATGRLYRMDVVMEQIRFDGMWVPWEITIDSNFSYVLGFDHHPEHTTFEFRNYRPKRE